VAKSSASSATSRPTASHTIGFAGAADQQVLSVARVVRTLGAGARGPSRPRCIPSIRTCRSTTSAPWTKSSAAASASSA
jgi:hypothetical protein